MTVMTDFPNGVTSFGVPVLPSGLINPFGKVWFLDAKNGADGYDGRSPLTPIKTMDRAMDVIRSGDTIFCWGKIAEQVTSPAGVFDVSIIGVSAPRHADDHTESDGKRGSSGASWVTPSSPTSATPLLTVQQQGWKLINVLFDGPSDAAAVQAFRDGGASSSERDASHMLVKGCKFVAGQNHIEFKGGLSQVVLEDNLFFGATADSILETVGAGIGTNNYFRILRNHFHNNESHIDIGANYASIVDNIIGKFTTIGIDLRTGSENVVTRNTLYGTYSNVGGYWAGTNDEWGGNYNSLSGGVTASDPA